MKLREVARLWGVDVSALSRGIAKGRVTHGVTRDEKGRVVDLDEPLAREDWRSGAARLPNVAGQPKPQVAPAAPGLDTSSVVVRLAQLEGEVIEALARRILSRAGLVVAGAVEALRELRGREPSLAELEDALLGRPEADWLAMTVFGSLLSEGKADLTEAGRGQMYRQSGREAVQQPAQEDSHGNEG